MQLNQETQTFIQAHLQDDIRLLALQASRYPSIDMPEALVQIAGRQYAARKIPTWSSVEGVLYPKHLSLEQCSSEITARYKAGLVEGHSLVDLTGGFGIDCSFMAQNFTKATYVECQKELCEIAQHNFPLLGLEHVAIVHADATEYLTRMEQADCLFIDPARRDAKGGKTIAISDCTPDIKALLPLLLKKAATVLIKLSPMLDLSAALADLPSAYEAHVVAVRNECKELLLLLKPTMPPSCNLIATNIDNESSRQRFVFTKEEEQASPCTYTSDIGQYLYEPNAAILKAGAYKSVAIRFGLEKLHPNSHLYTSNQPVADFPGRRFIVQAAVPFNKQATRQLLKDVDKANLTVRNFPTSVDELRKKLKLHEGGNCYLFATTSTDGRKLLIRCTKDSLSSR